MKKFLFLVSLALIACVLVGCTQEKKVEEKITVTDMLGRSVEVPKEVNKIVCIGPGALRLIVYLEMTNKVVGVEDAEKKWSPYGRPYRIAHPELADLPTIGQGGPNPVPHPEEIIKVNPDVIFATYVDVQQADNLQQKTGVPVVVLSYGQLATFDNQEVFDSLKLAGKILGKEKRADEVIEFIQNSIADLNSRTKDVGNERPSVYVGGIGYKGQHGIESTECSFPPFVTVNAKNVVDELNKPGHVFIDKEKLLEWNPDIIFIDENGLTLVKEDYKKNPDFYNSLKAFKDGKVYGILPFNYYTTNIGTALADAYYIGKVLYPDKFNDVNPEKKADEIFEFLVGKAVYNTMKEKYGGFTALADWQ
ncbi:iron ABC transporter substrate-binding protein [Archaeoglobales archaeon]|nr:MAG: iron ABC transporter substrate-binding protein [Archaeoglobales archaeon]